MRTRLRLASMICACVTLLAPAGAAAQEGAADMPTSYTGLLNRYASLAIGGKFADARDLAERAAGEEQYTKYAESLLEGAAAVGILEMRSSRRSKFGIIDETDPSGAMALALLDLQYGDAPSACGRLARAESPFAKDLLDMLRDALSPEMLVRQSTPEKMLAELAAMEAGGFVAPKLAEVRKLFRGRVTDYDPQTLRIEIVYDFRSAEQLKDWEAVYGGSARASVGAAHRAGAARRTSAVGLLSIRDGTLYMRPSGDRSVLAPGVFTKGSITADVLEGGSLGAAVLACADHRGNGYGMAVRPTGERHGLMLENWCRGSRAPLNFPGVPLTWFKKTPRMTLRFDAAGIAGNFGKARVASQVHEHACGRFGLDTEDKGARFDNVKLSGVLDRRWLMARSPEGRR